MNVSTKSTKPLNIPTCAEEMSLEEQTEMADEEQDETGLDVSPAGMADDLTCGDDMVAGVLLALNEARADEDMPRLTCSDRSTGTAANWAYLVAEKCVPTSPSPQAPAPVLRGVRSVHAVDV